MAMTGTTPQRCTRAIDYTILNGCPAYVRVRAADEPENSAKTFVVEGEAVPSYSAYECSLEDFEKHQ
jgi:hypothetical protein